MGHTLTALAAMFGLLTTAAASQPLLPRCSAGLDGQVSQGGCVCRPERGGQLTGRAAGWRWSCDLLRGPGMVEAVPPAGLPPPGLPPGFALSPAPAMRADSGDMGY